MYFDPLLERSKACKVGYYTGNLCTVFRYANNVLVLGVGEERGVPSYSKPRK